MRRLNAIQKLPVGKFHLALLPNHAHMLRVYLSKFLVQYGMCKTMINAWKLPKHHHLFNVLPTEVKENLDTEKLSYEPKNMKRKTTSSGNKDIMEF